MKKTVISILVALILVASIPSVEINVNAYTISAKEGYEAQLQTNWYTSYDDHRSYYGF